LSRVVAATINFHTFLMNFCLPSPFSIFVSLYQRRDTSDNSDNPYFIGLTLSLAFRLVTGKTRNKVV
jgi:hypothetical protein